MRLGDGEGSFGDSLQIREIVDAAGMPAYRALSYNADDGRIFDASTTEVVATMVQHTIECDDPALFEALQAALAEAPRTGSNETPVPKAASVKKKSAAKKPPPKKKAKKASWHAR